VCVPGKILPQGAGQSVIPLKLITAALSRIGYRGDLSTELFGARYQKENPADVASLCYKALEPYCTA